MKIIQFYPQKVFFLCYSELFLLFFRYFSDTADKFYMNLPENYASIDRIAIRVAFKIVKDTGYATDVFVR